MPDQSPPQRPQPACLVPDPAHLHLLRLAVEAKGIVAHATTIAPQAPCPMCRQPSARVHSHYVRRVADLPWQGVAVSLELQVRRFFCDNAACRRQIFVERLPAVVAPYARHTVRLEEALTLLGLALGGEAGARVVRAMGLQLSPDRLLARIRAAALPAAADGHAPRVLGVDDCAFRRGKRYGTLVVDLERHRVVDLLPDRTADILAAWSRAHPGAEIISRDRAGAYAEGARLGAPTAVQAADRFHLLKNLGEALEEALLQKGSALKPAAILTKGRLIAQALAAPSGRSPPPAPPPHPPSSIDPSTLYADRRGRRDRPQAWEQRLEESSLQRHAPRVAISEQARTMRATGAELAEIARALGVCRKTVARYLQLDAPPDRKRGDKRRAALAPYEAYLLQRWAEGCRNGTQLWREIRAQGYTRSRSNVARYITQLRREGPAARAAGRRGAYGQNLSALTNKRGPSARQVAFLLLRREADRCDEERVYLDALCHQDAALAQASRLSSDLARMLRERQGERRDTWLAEAARCGVAAFQRFAEGLSGDYAAVRAGLTLPYSNGQLEGQVNRLKVIKRQMYGRAGCALLRQRVLAYGAA